MLHASFLIGHLNYYVGYAGVYNKYMLQQTLYTLYKQHVDEHAMYYITYSSAICAR